MTNLIMILDNGEKVYELKLDGTTYTAYKNTAKPNQYNIVRHCEFDDVTVVMALHKKFITELLNAINERK